MNIAGGQMTATLDDKGSDPLQTADKPRGARMDCPACGSRGICRSSQTVTLQFRRLYYDCTNFKCSMRWLASLIFEHVVSPSGVNPDFNQPGSDQDKPQGPDPGGVAAHEQMRSAIRA